MQRDLKNLSFNNGTTLSPVIFLVFLFNGRLLIQIVLASIKYWRVHFLFLTQHFQSWLPPLILCGFTGSDLDVILGQFILRDFCRGTTHGIPALYTLGEGYDIPDAVGATDHRQHPLQTYTLHSVSFSIIHTCSNIHSNKWIIWFTTWFKYNPLFL